MEDVKWLRRRCGLPISLLLIFVIVGVICWGKIHEEEQKVAEDLRLGMRLWFSHLKAELSGTFPIL